MSVVVEPIEDTLVHPPTGAQANPQIGTKAAGSRPRDARGSSRERNDDLREIVTALLTQRGRVAPG